MRSLNEQFRFVGNNDELAVIAEQDGEQFITVVEKPQVTHVTYETRGDIQVQSLSGESFKAPSRPPKVTLEITGVFKEELIGENAEQHIPEIVDDMSVEELLCAVNRKLEDRGE